jgi:hypothetical protein
VETVGAYRLLRQVGEGGMGVVHLALAPDGSRVAVKILRPQVIGDREARQRLEREVTAMRRVRSPRVAECLDAEPWGQPPYVVTRYVPGLSLTEYVAEYGPLAGARLHRLAAGTAEALAGVHAAGVLHRDIKPSNVLLDRDEPVLIDFGLAMSGDESRMTHAGWIFGTPAYLAPEIVLGDPPTPAADVHAWAATVAFAATGRSPYGSGPSVVVLDRIRRGDYSLASVPEPLATLLRQCLDPQPHQRPTAVELCHALQRMQVEVGATGPAPSLHAGSVSGAATTTIGAQRSIQSVGHPMGPPPAGVAGGGVTYAGPAPAPPVHAPADPPGDRVPAPRPAPETDRRAEPQPGTWPPSSPVTTGTRALQWLSGLAAAAAAAGAVAISPYLAAALTVGLLVVVHASFAVGDRRRRLESRRGPRGRDDLVGVLVWPVHAMLALPVAGLATVLALVAAVGASSVQSLVAGGADASTVAGGAAFAVVLALGPAHSTLRRAGTAATRLVLTPPVAGVVTVLVLVTAALVLLVLAHDAPTWWFPFEDAPWRSLRDRI